MKNILLIFLAALIPFLSYSQRYDPTNNYGTEEKRLKVDSAFSVPVLTDTIFLSVLNPIANIIYVQSPTGQPDTGFWVFEQGRFKRMIAGVENVVTTNATIGAIYNADTWVNLDTFTSNFAGYSINGDSNIAFTSGSTGRQVLSLDRHTNLDRWSMSVKVIIGAKSSTSNGFGLGLFGVGDVSTADFYVYFNMTNHATQSGKLYMNMGVSVRDSSYIGLPFIVGDTVQLDFTYNYDNLKYTAKVYNFRSDSSVTSNFSGGELASQGLTTAFALPGISKFSVFSRSGDWVLDSFAISSNTIKNADIAFAGDSKGEGASVFDMFYSYPKRIMRVFPNSIQLAGQGNSVGDLEDLAAEVNEVNPKIILLNIGYNSFANGVNHDTINAQYARVLAAYEDEDTRVISLLPQYDNEDQTTLRNWIIANRTPEQYIDAYAATLALGSAGLYDGVHPNDTGSAVIANEILKSGKLDGLMLTDYNRHDNIRDDGYNMNIYEPVKIFGRKTTGATMSQGILSLYNPNNGTTGNDVSVYFFIDNNLTARRAEIEVGSNAPVGYRFMAFHLFGTTLVEVGRFSSYYNGLMLGIDTNQVFLFTGTARPKLMVGGAVGFFGARDKVDTIAYIGGNEDIDTRNHFITKRNSSTATLNFLLTQLHNGSGNFGLTAGLMHTVSSGGLDLLGVGITPTAALHVRAGTATAGGAPIKLTLGVNTPTPEAGAVEYDGTNYYATNNSAIRGNINISRTLRDAAGTLSLNLATYNTYIFTGTTTTWTLPAVAGTANSIIYIKNAGSGDITLNAAAAANEIYDTSLTNTITIGAGAARELRSDGTQWNVF